MKIVSKGVDSLESGLINKSNLRGAMFKKDPISIESENKDPIIAEKVAISAIERANEAVLIANRKFEYSIHEKTKQIMVKVILTYQEITIHLQIVVRENIYWL
jgi:hypothetical protein